MPYRDSAPLEFETRRYTPGALLHESPQASLYCARDNDTGTDVVLKCFEPGMQRSYLREASAALGMIHPRIVRCLDTFCPPHSSGCMVYEYLAGGTLADHLAAQGPLPPEEAWRCLREVAEGLAFLHRNGRIHCDLKPANVFLRSAQGRRPAGYVLGDLGAVCFIREAREGRHTAGTPAYIAPERVYDRFFFNSDLYSLGVLGFELATGERPFSGSAEEVIRAHLSRPPPLEKVADPDLRELLEHLLEKDPTQRIENAETLLALLGQPPANERPAVVRQASPAASHGPAITPAPPPSSEWAPYGVFELDPVKSTANVAAVLQEDGQPFVVLDHGSHAEILAPGTDRPGRIFAKVGRVGAVDATCVSYASSSRVFRLAPNRHAATSVWEGCRGLIGHVLSDGHLFWQSRYSLHYVDLALGRTHAFRARCYLSPAQAAILPDGRFCHSDGLANEQLVFRSAEAEPLVRHTLPGPILALAPAGEERALAVAADMRRRSKLLAVCSDSPEPIRTLPLPPDTVDWCCAPGRVFWLTRDGRVHAADATLETTRLTASLPGSTRLQVSPDQRWLVLLSHVENTRRLALWQIPNTHEALPG